MDSALEASPQRVRHHLPRPLAGSRNLLMKTAGNTLTETVPTYWTNTAGALDGIAGALPKPVARVVLSAVVSEIFVRVASTSARLG